MFGSVHGHWWYNMSACEVFSLPALITSTTCRNNVVSYLQFKQSKHKNIFANLESKVGTTSLRTRVSKLSENMHLEVTDWKERLLKFTIIIHVYTM